MPGAEQQVSESLSQGSRWGAGGGTTCELGLQDRSSCSLTPLNSPTKHKLRDKIIKNFRMGTSEHHIERWGPSERGTVGRLGGTAVEPALPTSTLTIEGGRRWN